MTEVTEITPGTIADLALPTLEAGGDKNSRGRLMVFGADEELVGATLLCGVAALRAGAGKLQLVALDAHAIGLGLAIPEARVIRAPGAASLEPAVAEAVAASLEGVDAVVVGPGTMEDGAADLAAALLAAAPRAAFLIDAAALSGLRRVAGARQLCAGRAVLTPHHGEMATLMDIAKDEVEADPLAVALRAARRFDAVVALKSAHTYIVAPDGRAWRNSAGTAGLGVCGSGDVLAGIIGGLLARGAPPEAAAVAGVYFHALAGRHLATEIGPFGYLARDLLTCLPRVIAQATVP